MRHVIPRILRDIHLHSPILYLQTLQQLPLIDIKILTNKLRGQLHHPLHQLQRIVPFQPHRRHILPIGKPYLPPLRRLLNNLTNLPHGLYHPRHRLLEFPDVTLYCQFLIGIVEVLVHAGDFGEDLEEILTVLLGGAGCECKKDVVDELAVEGGVDQGADAQVQPVGVLVYLLEGA